ncbi:hypothetical protein M5K25_007901 [Dendrobium thyrsiflorum]|uniref:SHSP domain-containing protein n=1 Tax=Dendrobium thyrsiflorum TaxID=117978 RepID=A0ABD0VE45_DENTH
MVERKCEGRDQASTYFQPSFEWLQDPCNYILQIQLPGFKKDDIKVQIDSTGKLTVRGTMQKPASFEQSYSIPTGSNVDKISGKYENNYLILTIPKSATVEPEKTKTISKGKKEESLLKDWLHSGIVDSVLEKVHRNRKVITVGLMAFSLGFCVSKKLRTGG